MRSDWMHVVSAHSHAISWTLLMTSSASRASARRSLSIRNIAWFRAARTSRSCCCTSSSDIGLPSVVRGGDVLLGTRLAAVHTEKAQKRAAPFPPPDRPSTLPRRRPDLLTTAYADDVGAAYARARPERHGPGDLAFHEPVRPAPGSPARSGSP